MTSDIDFSLTATDLSRLRADCPGAVIATPGDDAYAAEVATWNLAVELRPPLVVGARSADDVVWAVRWATERGLAIGINATGHGAVPNADDCLLISTRRMSAVSVDPDAAIATVAAGARMRDVTAAAAPYGLMPVQGSTGSTGATGFTLGGGLGVLSRAFGLAADHVLSIDVVTVDGRLHTVDADRDPDLFWALRGGKGNFGVVTSYRTALQELPTFYGGGIFFDGADAAAILRAYRRWITGHTDRTSSSAAVLRLPPDPVLPGPIRGRHVVHVRMAHIGDSAEGARLADGIRGSAPVLLDAIGQLPAASLDLVHQDPLGPLPAHERGCLLDELTDATIDAIAGETAGPADSPLVLAEIRNLGGAIARAPRAPSAVPGRGAPFVLFAVAVAAPPVAAAGARQVQALLDAVAPWRSPQTLPNFLGRSCTPAEVAAAWPRDTLDRLLMVKRAWDPVNQFRVGHALLAGRPPGRG